MLKYLNRLAEAKFLRLNNNFPAVLVCGPRQVGKTTMLMHLAKSSARTYVTLDDLKIRDLAISDPALFFQVYKPPIIIDEIQYAPNLFSQIKLMCDSSQTNGDFWLTGSQSYSIMKNVSESLAGRVGIMQMYGLTTQELEQANYETIKTFDLQTLQASFKNPPNIQSTFNYIFNGNMPKLIDTNDDFRKEYYYSYINTYIMRDAMELGKVGDIVKFNRFLTACATLVGNLLNIATLAQASGVSQSTAKEWLEVLVGMNIVYLLQPYGSNLLKRLVRTPKLYFYDTGLCAHILNWPSSSVLQTGPMAGAFFENYIINQINIKYQLLPQSPNLFFYRDNDQKEIDLVLENVSELIPLEIKLSANPTAKEIVKFVALDKLNKTIASGGIICLIDKPLPINTLHNYIPASIL